MPDHSNLDLKCSKHESVYFLGAKMSSQLSHSLVNKGAVIRSFSKCVPVTNNPDVLAGVLSVRKRVNGNSIHSVTPVQYNLADPCIFLFEQEQFWGSLQCFSSFVSCCVLQLTDTVMSRFRFFIGQLWCNCLLGTGEFTVIRRIRTSPILLPLPEHL
jgi:hypothetical protein